MIHPTDSNEHDVPLKRCTKCEQEWPATSDYYNRDKQKKDGLNSWCKGCIRNHHKSYYTRPEVLAKQRLHNAAWRKSPRGKEVRAAYRQDNHRELLAYRRDWYRRQVDKQSATVLALKERQRSFQRDYRNRPEVRERRRIYERNRRSRPESREQKRVYNAKRRARQRSTKGQYTHVQIQEMLNRQRYRCYYCQTKFKRERGRYVYQADHTFPLSRANGGDDPLNDISYIVLACPGCNRKKHNKYPWEWPEGGRLL